jgi:hypothetical protein
VIFDGLREANLDQLVILQRIRQLLEHALGHTLMTDLHDGLMVVRKTAQVSLLLSGK